MTLRARSIWVAVGAVLVGLVAFALVDHFWVGDRTIYFDDCRKRAALQDRLRAAGVPFKQVERNGILIARADQKNLGTRLGLPDLLEVPPDMAVACK
jgi:heme exporter protein D